MSEIILTGRKNQIKQKTQVQQVLKKNWSTYDCRDGCPTLQPSVRPYAHQPPSYRPTSSLLANTKRYILLTFLNARGSSDLKPENAQIVFFISQPAVKHQIVWYM